MDAYSMGCDDIDPIQLAEAQIPIDLPAEPEPHATMAPNPAETRLLCEDASKYPYNVPVADGSLVNSAQPSASGRTTSRKRKAPTKRDEDWELVKKRIIELHGTKTLSYIMTDVKQRYGFTASERQFKSQIHKWGLKKNVHGNEMRFIAQKQHERAILEPRKPELRFKVRGEVVKPANIERWKERTSFMVDDFSPISIDTPAGLSYRTVSQCGSIPGSPDISKIRGSTPGTPFVIQIPPRTSPIPSTPLAVNSAPVEGLANIPEEFELDFDGNLDLHIDATFGYISPVARVGAASSEKRSSIHIESTTDIIEDIAPQGIWNAAASPFSEFFDLSGMCFDFSDGFALTMELPYFKLQTLLTVQDPFPRGDDPMLDQGFMPRDRAITNVSLAERHSLLAGLLDHHLNNEVADYGWSFVSNLVRMVPERFQGEIETRVQQFFDPSNSRPLQYLFEVTAFFTSNNMLTESQIKNFLRWIIYQKYITQLTSFLRIDTTTTRAFSRNILEAAISIKNTEILQSLLLSGVDFQAVLQRAIVIDDDDFVKLLLTRIDSKCLSGALGGRLLLVVASTNRLQVADILVQNGADVNFYSYNRDGGTPLHRAVDRRQLEMARFLLENGADVNKWSYGGDLNLSTPLAAAVWYDPNYDIVGLLLEYGANIQCSIYGQNLLEYLSVGNYELYQFILKKTGQDGTLLTAGDVLKAAQKGTNAFLKFLSRNEGKVSQHHLEKALYESINQCDIETTLTLLESDVDPNGTTLDEPPLLVAAICEHEIAVCVAQHLIDAGASVNIDKLLYRAVEEGNFELLCLLLDAGADVEEYGPEALEKAVLDEEAEAVALLLDRGTPINAIGDIFCPIQAAAYTGSLELAQYLLDRGADVDTPAYGHKGCTALQAACSSGETELVTFLLGKGADVNAGPAATEGLTALEAVLSASIDIAVKKKLFQQLLEHGAKVSRSNGGPNPVIHTLIQNNLLDLLDVALKAGFDPNQMSRGKEGRTPLQLAAEKGRLEAAKVLLAHGALVNSPPAYQHGRTALQAAVSRLSPDMEMIQYLIDNEADVNADAGVCGGVTAIQGAAITGCIPVAQYLLEKGANVNSRPAIREGRTAIEGAAEHGRLDMVQLLINAGAKGDVVRGTGYKRAIDLAEQNGHVEVANLLKSAQ